jgi:hypothetical protein
MGELLKMSGNMVQRDSQARAILDRLSMLNPLPAYAPDETVLIQEILEGRAVTTGRLAMLEEIESKYATERK